MKLTPEQETIANYVSDTTGLTMVSAVAGSGKTTLLVSIANSITHTNGLYMAFNKALADESKHRFPSTTHCCTTHSLAYRPTVTTHKLKLGYFTYRNISHPLIYETKCLLVDLINTFCLSEFTSFSDFAVSTGINPSLVPIANHYLDLMQSGTIECTHAFYLKYYHILLADGSLSYEPFDFIMLDECVVGRTGIKTSDGVKSIVGLYQRQERGEELPKAKSFNYSTNEFEYKPVLKVFKNGTKDVFKVETNTKVSLKATNKHKVLTQRGYVEVKDLQPYKDYILSDSLDNLRINKLLNPTQLQVILGSYLGDGSLIQPHKGINSFSLRFTQGVAQKNYMLWKMSAFNLTAYRTATSGYTGELSILQTKQVPNFILDNDPFTEVLNNLDALGLAIWAMDDGTKVKPNNFIICSNSFTYDQNLQLSSMLKSKFSLTTKVVSNGKGHWQLYFNATSTKLLISIIHPYLDTVFTTKWQLDEVILPKLDASFKPYGASYVTSIKHLGKADVYDLTVQDNHNYITTSTHGTDKSAGLIVHNCGDLNAVTLEIFKLLPSPRKIMVGDPGQNIYSFNDTINGFKIMKPFGTTLPMTQSFRVSSTIATKIEAFGRKYLDPDMHFRGVEMTDPTIRTRAFISRTNGSLVGKMIELNRIGTPYSLVRPAKQIFRVPLLLCGLKHKGFIPDPEYKHLQHDVNHYYDDPTTKSNYKSLFAYLKESHSDDPQIQSALAILLKYGAKAIIDCYSEARKHEHSKSPYTLCSGHSSKG